MAGGTIPYLSYGAPSGSHASRVSMQAFFLYQVTPSKIHQLATAMTSVGTPLASSIMGYPFQRQPDK